MLLALQLNNLLEGAGASPPVLLGQIPNLSDYFSGADTYAIDPAVETGWSFDTNTGVLEIDTDDEDTFGPFTVTATNPNGDTDSNAFSVIVFDSESRMARMSVSLGLSLR
jgi:hypothetical protein